VSFFFLKSPINFHFSIKKTLGRFDGIPFIFSPPFILFFHISVVLKKMNEAKNQLLSVLQEALSQDYQRMRQAEETLKQWEIEPHFLAVMQVKKTLSLTSYIYT
jgi:hypothetical protein